MPIVFFDIRTNDYLFNFRQEGTELVCRKIFLHTEGKGRHQRGLIFNIVDYNRRAFCMRMRQYDPLKGHKGIFL